MIETRVSQRAAILLVLADGKDHPAKDFSGHYRRRYSILNELEREGLVLYRTINGISNWRKGKVQ